jgi:hypothetical protein
MRAGRWVLPSFYFFTKLVCQAMRDHFFLVFAKIRWMPSWFAKLLGLFYLSSPDLTNIRNPERETKLYLCSSTTWKLASGTFSVIYFFFHPPTHLETMVLTASRAYIFRRWRLVFLKLQKKCQVFYQTIREVFLTFFSKIKYGNLIWQTTGDALIGDSFKASTWSHLGILGGQFKMRENSWKPPHETTNES